MPRNRLHVALLNAGHFIAHLVMLVFATVSALALSREWGMGYSELVPYATPGFVAFGVFSMPAGWLADRWSREGMMVVYFIGVGLASILTGFARTPLEIAAGLFAVGIFAAIYHPVGLALIYDTTKRAGAALAANGVWGNLGVGSAALITGFFIDHGGWRAAFFVPGVVSILLGVGYFILMRAEIAHHTATVPPLSRTHPQAHCRPAPGPRTHPARHRHRLLHHRRFRAHLPVDDIRTTKGFGERLTTIAPSATWIGWLAFMVFAVGSMGQLVVGRLLDNLGPRVVFMTVAAMQVVFFALMPGLTGWAAVAVALAFMLGAFGQIPINDYMIGRMATPERRASIYGVRFVVTFAVLGAALPFISWVHKSYGFDTLFRILSVCAAIVLAAAAMLPNRLPAAAQSAPAVAE